MTQDVFSRNKAVLKFLGVLPSGSNKVINFLNFIHTYFIVIYHFIYVYSSFFKNDYVKVDFYTDIIKIATAISAVAASAKLIVLRWNREKLQHLLDDMDFFIETPESKLVLKVIRFYEIMVIMLISTHQGTMLHEKVSVWIENGADLDIISIPMYFYYGCTLLLTNVFVDTAFLLFCSQICCKLAVVKELLNSIGSEEKPKIYHINVKTPITDENISIACVEEHIKELKLKKTVEYLFNIIIAFQITYSFMTLCLALFAFLEDNESKDYGSVVSMLMSLAIEVFLFCWGGEMVKSHIFTSLLMITTGLKPTQKQKRVAK